MTKVQDANYSGPAAQMLLSYRATSRNLYLIGSRDQNVTILSQQVRALNLAWALQASGVLSRYERPRIAVIGGGFAGVSFTAGLLQTGAPADITLFERRDTLLPLQHGSDSRWIHPHIYDWPAPGSESSSAALPILNWTAGRASDVVVSVLNEWQSLVSDILGGSTASTSLRVFCNTRHLRVDEASTTGLLVEFVGEAREPATPAVHLANARTNQGSSEEFDIAVLALGFGLERDNAVSYWRNENMGQPVLGQAAEMYIVSGGGDGAMIDLLRLRISQFRQDRILSELFGQKPGLVRELRSLKDESVGLPNANLFQKLDDLWSDPSLKPETTGVLEALESRLRQDTNAVLHLRDNRFARIFSQGRISFQNRLLIYLLYRCGGFYPSSVELADLRKDLGVPKQRVIVRHGTDRDAVLSASLSDGVLQGVNATAQGDGGLRQADDPSWPAGFFGYRGSVLVSGEGGDLAPGDVADSVKAGWRKEYLPAPTQAIAASFISAIAGFLGTVVSSSARLRVTLHRTLLLGGETLLQQCCEYTGLGLIGEPDSVIGRTFPVTHGTIGAAFTSKCVMVSRPGVGHSAIADDMERLALETASREMPDDTASVLAIPVVSDGPLNKGCVVAVLYADCSADGVFNPDVLRVLVSMVCHFAEHHLARSAASPGVSNGPFWTDAGNSVHEPVDLSGVSAIEASDCDVPTVADAEYLNYEYSDFERVTA